jgi:hypothetical protein
LAIREATGGDVASSLSALAQFVRSQGDVLSARPLIERALDIREKSLGPHDPIVGDTLIILAALWLDSGQPATALLLSERAVAILETTRGPHHPSLVLVLLTQATVKFEMGDLESAQTDLDRGKLILQDIKDLKAAVMVSHNYAQLQSRVDIEKAAQSSVRAGSVRPIPAMLWQWLQAFGPVDQGGDTDGTPRPSDGGVAATGAGPDSSMRAVAACTLSASDSFMVDVWIPEVDRTAAQIPTRTVFTPTSSFTPFSMVLLSVTFRIRISRDALVRLS